MFHYVKTKSENHSTGVEKRKKMFHYVKTKSENHSPGVDSADPQLLVDFQCRADVGRWREEMGRGGDLGKLEPGLATGSLPHSSSKVLNLGPPECQARLCVQAFF